MSKPGSDTGLFVPSESPAEDITELIRKRTSNRPTSQMPPDQLAAFLVEFQRQRWKLGVKVLVEDILRDHAKLRDAPQLSMLIYNEFLLRKECGETPSLEEYQSRFPLHAHRLEKQIKQDQTTTESSPLGPEEHTASKGNGQADAGKGPLAQADDLKRFQNGEATQARPVAPVGRWPFRRPAVALLAVLIIVLAAGGGAGVTMAWIHARPGWNEADRPREFGLLPGAAGPQEQIAKQEKKLWAAISASTPIRDWPALSVDVFMVQFGLVNDGDKTVDPEIESSQLLVNGKQLENWDHIIGNGPRSKNWKALAPKDHVHFGYALGKHFEEPGIYKLKWKGKDFESAEIVLRVMPKR